MFYIAGSYIIIWRILVMLYVVTSAVIPISNSQLTCTFSFLGEPASGDPLSQLSSDSVCNCTASSSGGSYLYVYYGDLNVNLGRVCGSLASVGGPFGAGAHITGPDSGPLPSWANTGGQKVTSLKFSGGDDLVVDGALLATPTGEHMDMAANGTSMPLLHFSQVNGLVLRNLIFRDLNILGPLIMIEDCTNVTIHNVSIELVMVGRGGNGQYELEDDTQHTLAHPAEISVTPSSADGAVVYGSSGVVFLRNVSLAHVEGVNIESLYSFAGGLHGLLVASSQEIYATNLRVHNFRVAASDGDITAAAETSTGSAGARGSSSTSAVAVLGSNAVSVFRLDCSSSAAASCGPCLTAVDSTLTVASSSFTGNSAENEALGGALCIESWHPGIESRTTLVETTFSGNRARKGGAIALTGSADGSAPILELKSASFSANQATEDGGDIYASRTGTLSVDSSSFDSSVANQDGLSDLGMGGCIFGVSYHVSLINSSFNQCKASHGGALWLQNGNATSIEASFSYIVVNGCRFTSNYAQVFGGGLAALPYSPDSVLRLNLSIADSNFSENTAGQDGGAVWLAVEEMDDSVAAGSVLASVLLRDVNFVANGISAGSGGALFAAGWDIQLEGGEVGMNFGPSWVSDALGGAMLIRNCPNAAKISNVKYWSNTGYYGGAIAADWCSVTLWNTELNSNQAYYDGGAIFFTCYQAGSLDRDTDVYAHTLHNVTMEGNVAVAGEGGGISSQCGSITVTDSKLTRNNAIIGGGISVARPGPGGMHLGDSPQALFRRVSLVGNTADLAGGGLKSEDVNVIMDAMEFSDNTVTAVGSGNLGGGAMRIVKCRDAVDIRNVTCVGNKASQGGASLFDMCDVIMRNVTFTGNIATSSDGGALFAIGRDTSKVNMRISGATFEGNVAAVNGGVLRAYQVLISVTDVGFRGNEASSGRGGAVYLDETPSEATDANIKKAATFNHCQFLDNNAGLQGGAMYHSSAIVEITSCLFLNNSVGSAIPSPDGWSSSSGGAIFGTRCKDRMLLSACELGRNRAEERGGAVTLLTCPAVVEGSYFHDNSARLSGGAVAAGRNTGNGYAMELSLILRNSNLTRNNAEFEDGGSLFVDSLPLSLMDSRLESNVAKREGGALYLESSPMLDMLGSTLRGNVAGVSGGAVHATGIAASVQTPPAATLQDMQLQENHAQVTGGALWLSGWHLELRAADFNSNSVGTMAVAGEGNAGGAMYMANCVGNASMMSDSNFFGNVAYQGGALFAQLCSMVATNATFVNNNATGGDAGAIAAFGLTNTDSSSLPNETYLWDLRKTTIRGNTAGGIGGGLRAYFINIVVTDSYFLDNSAVSEGGAVHLQFVPPSQQYDDQQQVHKPGLFERCKFERNIASDSGGAIFHETTALHLSNCTFYANHAGGGLKSGFGGTSSSGAAVVQGISMAGGAIFATSCSAAMEIRSSELGKNQADGLGGGIALLSCKTLLESSYLYDNVAKLSGGSVAAGYQATITLPEGQPLTILNCNLTGNKGMKGDGGSVHTSNVPLILQGCWVLNNTAQQRGGALFSLSAPSILLRNNTLAGNSAGSSGGATWFESPAIVQVNGTRLLGNAAEFSGGGLALSNPQCTHIENVYLTANTAAQGGGVYVTMPEFTMTTLDGRLDCLGDFGRLLGDGWAHRFTNASMVQIKDNDVIVIAIDITAVNNLAQSGHGGAILLEETRGSILFDSCIARANRAGNAGGGIAVTNGRIAHGTLYLSSSYLGSNTAAERGGALSLGATNAHQQVVVVNTTMHANNAGVGGAVSLQQMASVALHNCVLEGNIADGGSHTARGGSGGSIHASGCEWLLANATSIQGSAATRGGHGGGMYTEDCKVVMLSNVSLQGNNASGSGGAAFLTGSSGISSAAFLAVISGGNMKGNTAGVDGGGSKTSTSLATGSAGALFLEGSMAVLVDQTLFEGNVAETQGGAVGIGLECPQAPDASPRAESSNATLWLQQEISWLSLGIRELPAIANLTLLALRQAASRSSSYSCWTAIFNEPLLWGNRAGSSGGAVFSSSPYTLAVICGRDWSSTAIPDSTRDQRLAGLVNITTSRVASPSSSREVINVVSGRVEMLPDGGWNAVNMTAPFMGILPTSESAKASCFRRPPTLSTTEAVEQHLANKAGMGYGDALATAAKVVALVATSEGDTTLAYTANNRAILGSAPASWDVSSLSGTGVVGSDGAGNAASRDSQQPYWVTRAVLQVDGLTGTTCWPGQECRLTMPTNVAVGLNVSIFDAASQVVNDTGTLRPVVRATILSFESNTRADLLGNPLAQVDGGSASLAAVRIHARKGNYTLALALDNIMNLQVTPLLLNVTVPPCSLGELPVDSSYMCSKCAINTFSLYIDGYDIAGRPSPPVGSCEACPYNSICTGGAVLVPGEGYWHSAANSTLMHQCPNPEACRQGDTEANNELLRCQERWYAYFGESRRLPSLLLDATGGSSLVGSYLDVYRRVAAVENNTYNGSLSTPLIPDGTFDGFLLDCALWGAPDDDPLSYMQKQCTKGHSGRLCATCSRRPVDGEYYALLSDLSCKPCFSKAASAFIGLAFFVANTVWLGFSVLMTFLTDYNLPNEDGLPAADLLKVLIVHYQFFAIVTRININWPKSIIGLQALLGSVTGSVQQVYSPSCLWPGADSATQAKVQVLAGLLMPIFSVIIVLFLWSLRYLYWNQGTMRLTRTNSRRSQSLSGFTSPSDVAASTLPDTASSIRTIGSSLAQAFSGSSSSGYRAARTKRSNLMYSRSMPVKITSRADMASAMGTGGSSPTSPGASMLAQSEGAQPRCSSRAYLPVASTCSIDAPGQLSSTETPAIRIQLSFTRDSCSSAALTPPKAAANAPAAVAQVPPDTVKPPATATVAAKSPAATTSAKAPTTAAAAGPADAAATPPSVFALAQVAAIRAASARGSKEPIPKLPAYGTSVNDNVGNLLRQGPSDSIGDASTGLPTTLGDNAAPGKPCGTCSGTGGAMQKMMSYHPSRNRARRSLYRSLELNQLSPLSSVNLSPLTKSSSVDSPAVPPPPDAGADGEERPGLFRLFSKRESLSYVDNNMPLLAQMFLVLMVSSFVLMPAWATEALSIFSCYRLDDGSGAYPENQRATWPYGYWLRDMNQECYTGRHLTVWVPVGIVSVVMLSLAMPITCGAIMYQCRKRLHEVEVMQVYGFLYRSYKTKYFFWESVTQAQTLLLVVVEVFGRTLWVLHQALLIEVMLLVILMINTYFSPLVHDQLTSLQLLSLGTICLTVVLGLFTSMPMAELSTVSQNLLGALILFINSLIILGFLVLFFVHVLPTLKKKATAVASQLGMTWSRFTPRVDGQPSVWIRLASMMSFRRQDSNHGADAAAGSGDGSGDRGGGSSTRMPQDNAASGTAVV